VRNEGRVFKHQPEWRPKAAITGFFSHGNGKTRFDTILDVAV